MAARAFVMISWTMTPAARFSRVYGPRHGQIKWGPKRGTPSRKSGSSGRLIPFRGLLYWRWFGLVVFERDDLFRPGSQLRVMLLCVFGRKPIDRREPIGIRRCCDFRPRHDRFPRKP